MKKYGNDYRQNGKQFEYTGKWHSTKAEAKELKQYAWSYTGLMIAAMIVYVAGLMINNAGIMGGVSLLLFCRNQEGKGQTSQVVIPEEHVGHMTRAQYEKGIRRPVRCSIAIVGFAFFTCVADLILILLKPTDLVLTRELLFEVVSAITLTLGSAAAVQSCRTKVKFTIFE